jgi:hypothetical protein
MDLSKYESMVKGFARRYEGEESREDLEQLAGIAVWQYLTKNPDAPNSYVGMHIKGTLSNNNRKLRAKKRKPKEGLRSLNTPVGEKDSRTLEDFIGEEDEGYTSERELIETLYGITEFIMGIL